MNFPPGGRGKSGSAYSGTARRLLLICNHRDRAVFHRLVLSRLEAYRLQHRVRWLIGFPNVALDSLHALMSRVLADVIAGHFAPRRGSDKQRRLFSRLVALSECRCCFSTSRALVSAGGVGDEKRIEAINSIIANLSAASRASKTNGPLTKKRRSPKLSAAPPIDRKPSYRKRTGPNLFGRSGKLAECSRARLPG